MDAAHTAGGIVSASLDLGELALTEANAPELSAGERTLLTWLLFGAVTARLHARGRGVKHTHYSVAELVLEHGRLFTPTPLPRDLTADESGRCWESAHTHADRLGRELVYVEGFATTESVGWMGIEHAWCTRFPGGIGALDTTWSPIGEAYVGVPFCHLQRWRSYHRNHPQMLTSSHQHGRRLLREGVPSGAVLSDLGRPLPAAARMPDL